MTDYDGMSSHDLWDILQTVGIWQHVNSRFVPISATAQIPRVTCRSTRRIPTITEFILCRVRIVNSSNSTSRVKSSLSRIYMLTGTSPEGKVRAGTNPNDVIAGLEGFEPTTAGLRVLRATWLRHRPTILHTGKLIL